ncbi:MAG: SusC/RagA family TonB-linked outer membrane protein, partial [Bacteroidales bacterium]
LDMHYGGYMFSNTKDYLHWTGAAAESVMNDREPFIVPNSVIEIDNGDGTFSYKENNIPVIYANAHTFYGDYGAFESDLYNVIDKSYLKLRDVSLSYTLPASFTNKFNVNNLRFSFVMGNILLWTPADNPYIDPETTSFGNDISALFGEFMGNPTNQSYTFGMSFNF